MIRFYNFVLIRFFHYFYVPLFFSFLLSSLVFSLLITSLLYLNASLWPYSDAVGHLPAPCLFGQGA